jgi:hypothetical protein
MWKTEKKNPIKKKDNLIKILGNFFLGVAFYLRIVHHLEFTSIVNMR